MAMGMLLTSLAFLILFVAAKSGGDQTFVTDAQGQFVLDDHRRIEGHPAPGLADLADRRLHGDLARRADAQPDGPVARLEGRAVPDARADDGRMVRRHGDRQQADGDRHALDQWYHSSFWLLCSLLALGMAFVLLVLLRPLKKAMPGV